MNRILGLLALLVVLALGAAYLGSPFLAFRQLQQAAQAGDRDKLEALVDFPAVRENLKRQVDSRVTKLARESGGIGFLPLQVFSKLGKKIGDDAVDRYVTPDAIAEMVTEGKRPDGDGPPAKGAAPKVKADFAYLTLDRVRVAVAPAGHPQLPVALIMDRRGVFSWRVVAIVLPGDGGEVDAKDLY